MTSAEPHTLSGAYALNALSPEERATFEGHLADCRPCATEVAELLGTAARLGQAVSDVPPPKLKQRVLSQIATVRQEPPRVSSRGRAEDAGGSRESRTLPRLVLAVCLAGVVVFGGSTVWQYQQAQEARQEAQQAREHAHGVSSLLTAPDAEITSGQLPGGATSTVVLSREQDRAAFLAVDMPTPPSGKVYQLWYDDGGSLRSAGLMDPGSTDTSMMLEGAPGQASGMGITVEPAGGSKQPTSEPLVTMELPG